MVGLNIMSYIAVPYCCSLFYIYKSLSPPSELLHCFNAHPNFIFLTNKHECECDLQFDKENDTHQITFVKFVCYNFFLSNPNSASFDFYFFQKISTKTFFTNSPSVVSSTYYANIDTHFILG